MDKKMVNRVSEILNPTEDQKDRMFSNILTEYENKSTQQRGFTPVKRLRPILAGAIAACLLITTTAFAATYWGMDTKLLNFLNPSSAEQAEYLASGAYVVDKQVKNKNGTLEIKQVIGDSNVTLILMDFIAPEGTVLNKPHYSFEDMYTNIFENHGFYGYGIISLKDEDMNDNKISMVMRIKNRDSFMGKEIHLKFTDLQGADTIPGEFTTAVPGKWETRFKLNFKNYSTTYQLDKSMTIFGYEAILKTVSISPISVALHLDSHSSKDIFKASENWKTENGEALGLKEDADIYPIKINYEDGTSETTSVLTGLQVIGTDGMWFIKTFEKVINDKEIKSIIFFDTEITITH